MHGGGNMCHLTAQGQLILADGKLCLPDVTPNEKAMVKCDVHCTSATHAGLRSWHKDFQQFCHDHGYYAHPLWCFRQDHGGEWGFTCGNDPDDDLPARMMSPCSRMSHTICRALHESQMFIKTARFPEIVRSCDGNGYRALKALLHDSHPAFYDQPATLITAYPKQVNSPLLECHNRFLDYLQLRACITNQLGSLNDEHELDIFINNSKCSTFLNRVTRDERRMPSLKHK